MHRRPGGAAVRGLEQPVVFWAIDRAPLDRIAKRRRRKSEIVEPRSPVRRRLWVAQVLPPLVERYTKLAPETAVTKMSLLRRGGDAQSKAAQRQLAYDVPALPAVARRPKGIFLPGRRPGCRRTIRKARLPPGEAMPARSVAWEGW